MEKILVTGSDGFIGSHLTEALQSNYDVRAVMKYSSSSLLNNLKFLDPQKLSRLEIVKGDIKDPDFCDKIMKDCRYVFHLASLISIPYSYENPNDYLHTNIAGTANLLNAARRIKQLKNFIYISTSEVYGTAQYTPIDELHPLQPQSPYSASKIGAESFAMSYHLSFDLPVTIIRPFNTYGPRQSRRAIIPKIIHNLINDLDVRLGNVNPKRDFLYVKDTVSGFLSCLDSLCIGKIINIGTGKNISMKDLFHLIQEKTGHYSSLVIDETLMRPNHSEVQELLCNYSKINLLTGWKPKYDLDSGLDETIQWYNELREIKESHHCI